MEAPLPNAACQACRFNYRIVRVNQQTSCGHTAAVVELLSFDDLQVLQRQPFVVDDYLTEAVLDWLTGPVEGPVIFPPFGCREVMAKRIAEEILHRLEDDIPEDMIDIEIPTHMLNVSDWVMHFWDIQDRILANCFARCEYSIEQIAELPEDVLFSIRLVGSGQRGKAAVEARKRHNRLPPEAHYLLYRMTGGRDGRKPPA